MCKWSITQSHLEVRFGKAPVPPLLIRNGPNQISNLAYIHYNCTWQSLWHSFSVYKKVVLPRHQHTLLLFCNYRLFQEKVANDLNLLTQFPAISTQSVENDELSSKQLLTTDIILCGRNSVIEVAQWNSFSLFIDINPSKRDHEVKIYAVYSPTNIALIFIWSANPQEIGLIFAHFTKRYFRTHSGVCQLLPTTILILKTSISIQNIMLQSL